MSPFASRPGAPHRIPKGAFSWTPPDVVRAAFETHQQNPDGWVSHAWSLKLCADAIADLWMKDLLRIRQARTSRDVPHLRSGPIFLMLAGLAIENLLKAILIRRAGRFRPEWISHELARLCRDAGVRLNSVERQFVRRLTDYVEWAGKYAAPTKPSKMQVPVRALRADLEAFRELFVRLERLAIKQAEEER